MSEELELALLESRTSAEATAKQIQQTLERYARSGSKEADRNVLKYGFVVLRSICQLISKQHYQYLEIYCDIVQRTLQPFWRPALSPTHWARCLENLRYMFYIIVQQKRYKEAAMIFTAVMIQSHKLQCADDYKAVLYIYGVHLLSQRSRLAIDAAAATKEINAALQALTALFAEMLRHGVQSRFVYTDLMAECAQHFCKQYNFHATMGEDRQRMYKAYFALLGGAATPPAAGTDATVYAQNHLELLNALVQIDVLGGLKSAPTAVLHLQLCRTLPPLQASSDVAFAFTMLYYVVKFAYGLASPASFAEHYTELCAKHVNYYGKQQLGHQWHQDYLVVMSLVLVQLHQPGSACFEPFWVLMGANVDCYAAHMDLLFATSKVVVYVMQSRRAPWTCCASTRKHIILALAQCGLAAYAQYTARLAATPASAPATTYRRSIVEVQQTLSVLVRQGVAVLLKLPCAAKGVPFSSATVASNDLKNFYAYFSQVLREASATHQLAHYALTLADQFAPLRAAFHIGDWVNLLHRLSKLAPHAGDETRTNEQHAWFVCSLLLEPSTDWTQLRSQVAIYYMPGDRVPRGSAARQTPLCLLECWQRSGGALKPALTVQQQRLLHWLETQHLFKYQKAGPALQQSLLRCAHTRYEALLVMRQAKLTSTESYGNLQTLSIQLRVKGAARTRLEHLMLAHVITALIAEAKAGQHKVADVDGSMCLEENLEQLLQRKDVLALKVADEKLIADLAVDALAAFRCFYELADLAPISMSEALIDWEAVCEDMVVVAQHLHLVGYLEAALFAWLLLFHIADTISDRHSALRALAFCCEHVEHFEGQLDVPGELKLSLRATVVVYEAHLLHALQQLPQLNRRQQGHLLVALCQLAYYHAHVGHSVYAQQLLSFVQRQHVRLPERHGKYDLVQSTWDAVRIRILWKKVGGMAARADVEAPLLRQCLLRMVDGTLERFREFVFVSSSDSVPYMCLLFDLTQQVAECAANRLYDSAVNGLFVSVLRLALQYGSALRVVQLLTAWMWSNLQMEQVKKAEVKLRFIESLLGVPISVEQQQPQQQQKRQQQLSAASGKHAHAAKQSEEHCHAAATVSELFASHLNLGLETIRKVVPPAHVSPIRTQKLELSSTAPRRGLRSFLRTNSCGSSSPPVELQPNSDWLDWCHFAVGCLNARLYYLIEDYEQLEDFYAQAQRWQQTRANNFNQRFFRHYQLLSLQHHVNVLRATGKHELALKQLDAMQTQLVLMYGKVDTMYGVVAQLQRRTIHIQLQRKLPPAQERAGRAQLRRALTFNTSFEERQHQQQQQQRLKASVYATLSASASAAKTPLRKLKPIAFKIFSGDDDDQKMQPPQTPLPSASASAKKPERRRIVHGQMDTCQVIELSDLLNSSDEEGGTAKACAKAEKVASKASASKRNAAKPLALAMAASAPKTPRRTPSAVGKTEDADPEQKQLTEKFSLLMSQPASNDGILKESPALVDACASANVATRRGRLRKAPLVKQQQINEDADNADNNNNNNNMNMLTPVDVPKSRIRKLPIRTVVTPMACRAVHKEFATPITAAAMPVNSAVKTTRRRAAAATATATTKRENDENAVIDISTAATPTISTRRRQRT